MFLLRKDGQASAQDDQGSDRVTVPEVFKNHGDVALRDMISGHGGHLLGSDDPMLVFVPMPGFALSLGLLFGENAVLEMLAHPYWPGRFPKHFLFV